NRPDAQLRRNIIDRIAASRRLQVSEDPGKADAFLFWSLKRSPTGQRMEARLTDRQGRNLWDASRPIGGGDQETASRAASKLAQNLLDEMARREGRAK